MGSLPAHPIVLGLLLLSQTNASQCSIDRVGQNHMYIYGAYTVFLAGKSLNIRLFTVVYTRFLWPILSIEQALRCSNGNNTQGPLLTDVHSGNLLDTSTCARNACAGMSLTNVHSGNLLDTSMCARNACAGMRPSHVSRVGQNRVYTMYMTVYLVISLPKAPYMHRIYMVLANPTHEHMSIYKGGG
jgi:hypothetical protein